MAFVITSKQNFDLEYEQLLRKRFEHDDGSYKRYMNKVSLQVLIDVFTEQCQAKSKAAIDLWEERQRNIG